MKKEDDDSSQISYRAPAVHKAFQLLRTVATSKDGLRLVELADRLGFSRSTTHGLVHALLRESALIQDDSSRELFLGPLIGDLAFADWNNMNRLAQAVIDEIRDRVHATVIMGVRIRNHVMITAAAEARESFRIAVHVGTNLPLFAGAAGKVLLAQETNESVLQLIARKGLPHYTPNSILNAEQYIEELDRVRSQGYAVDDEEYLAGIRAVAVALENQWGFPAAIWVVGIATNMGLERLEEVAEITAVSAKRLRSQLETMRGTRFGSWPCQTEILSISDPHGP